MSIRYICNSLRLGTKKENRATVAPPGWAPAPDPHAVSHEIASPAALRAASIANKNKGKGRYYDGTASPSDLPINEAPVRSGRSNFVSERLDRTFSLNNTVGANIVAIVGAAGGNVFLHREIVIVHSAAFLAIYGTPDMPLADSYAFPDLELVEFGCVLQFLYGADMTGVDQYITDPANFIKIMGAAQILQVEGLLDYMQAKQERIVDLGIKKAASPRDFMLALTLLYGMIAERYGGQATMIYELRRLGMDCLAAMSVREVTCGDTGILGEERGWLTTTMKWFLLDICANAGKQPEEEQKPSIFGSIRGSLSGGSSKDGKMKSVASSKSAGDGTNAGQGQDGADETKTLGRKIAGSLGFKKGKKERKRWTSDSAASGSAPAPAPTASYSAPVVRSPFKFVSPFTPATPPPAGDRDVGVEGEPEFDRDRMYL